jgi:hypothetical protein
VLPSALALILLLTAGAPAAASTAELSTDAEGGLRLVVSAGSAEANGFEIAKGDQFSSFPDQYRIRDRIPNSTNYNPISPGNGCMTDPVGPAPGVICSPAGFLRIIVATGDQSDFVRLETGIGSGANATVGVAANLGEGNDEFLDLDNNVPDFVRGEGGDDAISTFGADDVIDGGPGSDQHLRRESSNGDEGLVGGDGADEIYADDGGTRDLVDCGLQSDRAHVDNADVVTACETLVRPSPPGVDPPVLGSSVNVAAVSGEVFVAVPEGGSAARRGRVSQKGLTFVPLEEARQVPVGSFVDTRRGTVGLTSARNSQGDTQSAKVLAGVFQVLQSRRRRAKGLTQLRLAGGSFRGCRARGDRSSASVAELSRRTVRRLRARARGRFRTRGRHSAATVRGTSWDTVDRCDGTLTKVKRGRVVVRDFRLRKNILLSAGKSYLAR